MRINKNYDIAKLAEELKETINDSKKHNGGVRIDIITANNILDVLEEIQRREQKHQTIESALTFIEKEDGTQTNLMELTNSKKTKTICNDCLMAGCCTLNCLKEHITKEMLGDKTNCFGKYHGMEKCGSCEYTKQCIKVKNRFTELVKEDRLPECFGVYDEEVAWGNDCYDCKYKAMCEMMEDNKKINE